MTVSVEPLVRRWLPVACAVVLTAAVALGWGLRGAWQREPVSRLPEPTREALRQAGFVPAEVLRPAPPLELRELSGRSESLAGLRGRVVLLNFWSTTCVHCLHELPNLERLNEDLRNRGLTVVSVCFDEDDPGEVGKLARRYAHDLPIYTNPDGKAAVRYDVQVMPCLYLIDAQGRLVGRAEGAHSWTAAELAPLVQHLGTRQPWTTPHRATFHRRSVPSPPAVTACRPSLVSDSPRIGPRCSSKMCSGLPVSTSHTRTP